MDGVIIPLAVILLLAGGSDYNLLLLISRAVVDSLPQDVLERGLPLIQELVLVPLTALLAVISAFWPAV